MFEQEPLPPESRLWDLENVIVCPHMSGAVEGGRRLVGVFYDNVGRWVRRTVAQRRRQAPALTGAESQLGETANAPWKAAER